MCGILFALPRTVAMDDSLTEVETVPQDEEEAFGAVVYANPGMKEAAEQELGSHSQPKGILTEPKTYEEAIPHSVEPQEVEKEDDRR